MLAQFTTDYRLQHGYFTFNGYGKLVCPCCHNFSTYKIHDHKKREFDVLEFECCNVTIRAIDYWSF